MTDPGMQDREAAIRHINRKREVVAISLLWSQTVDLFATRVADELRPQLDRLRRSAPDGVKVPVESILHDEQGWRVTLDGGMGEEILLPDAAVGEIVRTPGGGLANLASDMKVLLAAFGAEFDIPPIEHLSWEDSAAHFGAIPVPGRSRTSLILQEKGFAKLILTEKGPSWERNQIDPFQVERDFYGNRNAFIFIGQEPVDSHKFDLVRKAKLGNPSLKVFWLVGGNQLKQLYTEYRDFLSVVDVVSFNLAEATGFFGFEPLRKHHRDASELRKMVAREISRRTLELGAWHVVITDGAKGASLARKARGGQVDFVYSPLIHENVVQVDSAIREDTGCGDSFAASIAAYFLSGPERFKLNEAANFAHYVAGIVFQRSRPNLNADDLDYVKAALAKARAGGPLVAQRVSYDRTRCQIKPGQMLPRGPAKRVLVLLLGGDPADPTQPHVTGAAAALWRLGEMMRTGDYPLAPLVRIVPRISINPAAKGKAWLHYVDKDELERMVAGKVFCKAVGNQEDEPRNGVRLEDLMGPEGVYLLRVGLWEAIEILSSEDFAEMFGDIKFWHFATENVDERIAWHARQWGVTREQGQEIVRQSLRDYVVEHIGPQVRFSHARATNLEEFYKEMTEQLILRVDELLAGIFRPPLA
ncbi:MAG: carbohydrate kinase family protein [Alphaproteobacteria bacterium]|nr:carbohydrate kinase family protein [Alphaproteobacteria bacterium]